MKRRVGLFLTLSLVGGLQISATDLAERDQTRSAWRWRCAVSLPADLAGPAFVELALPPEVAAACQRDLRDLRLIDAAGGELPFVIDRQVERQAQRRWEGRLVDVRSEKELRTVWMVDLNQPRTFDTLELNIDQSDFAKRIQVEASDDRSEWRLVAADAGVFDQRWDFRVHDTTIELKEPVTARYLRLSADDKLSPPITVQGLSVAAVRPVPGERWTRRATLTTLPADGAISRYRLEEIGGLPFDRLELQAGDSAFTRHVTLYEERGPATRPERVALGWANLYRLQLPAQGLSSEQLTLQAAPPQGGALVLEIENGDSPPLRALEVADSGVATRLLFPIAADSGGAELELYFGNRSTRAPIYDLERLKTELDLHPEFVPARIGPTVPNPRFQEVPPLQFVAGSGALLESWRWKQARQLVLPAAEDIYAASLAPLDLAALRPDLADLRIADPSGRQVPFILERGAAEAPLQLAVFADPIPERGSERRLSRYRLEVPGSTEGVGADGIPLEQLQLSFREHFYSRPARLLAPVGRGSRRRERLVFSWALTRREGRSEPVKIELGGGRFQELFLEIEEGDNTPLHLESARALVRVPRVVFKLKPEPGPYRLLLGNPAARMPQYDLESLRGEVLAYSAVPVALKPLDQNPAYRRHALDYFSGAPQTVLLWAALVIAIAALLLLTVRLLNKETAGGR